MDWDQRLQIDTEGMDERLADWHHFRYEPTPYEVLERLLDSGYIHENSHVFKQSIVLKNDTHPSL